MENHMCVLHHVWSLSTQIVYPKHSQSYRKKEVYEQKHKAPAYLVVLIANR